MSEKKEYEYTPFSYESFKESDTTKGYGQLASDWEKTVSGWGDYTWDRQGEYDTLFKNYQNRPDFSYDFNTDALYQQYKDKYIQQGKMAMQDTIGQASAMTGGYGNSYATTAGSQAYQASLQNLNDVIPELYQLALNRYNQKGQDMLNQLGILSNERTFDYGAWSDKYNRAVGNRDYYGTRYDNSLSNDWTMYDSNRDLAYSDHTTAEGYEYQTGRDAIADEQWEKSYNLSERELKIAEEEWAQKKNDVEEEDDFVGPPQYTEPAKPAQAVIGQNIKPKTATDEPDYSGWDALDWEGYFAQIRNTESKSAAEEELDRMVKAGLIPQKMITYAAIGARGKLGH